MKDFTLAEYSVVGSILIDARCLPVVRQVLPDEKAFSGKACAALYAAACRLDDEGAEADLVRIANLCPEVDESVIRDLMNVTATAVNAEFYARQVLEGYRRRKQAEIGQALMESNGASEEIAAWAITALSEFRGDAGKPDSGMGALMRLRTELETGERRVLHTNFPSLDRYLGGLQPGGLYIIGARPSIGKSAFGIALADLLAQETSVLFLSLEMSEAEINARRVAAFSKTLPSYQAILSRQHFSEEQNADFAITAAELASRPLSIRQEAHLTSSKVGALARLTGAQVLIVDYIGLMESPEKTEYERITQLSGDLKRLAQTMGIVVIALCQMNRSTELTRDCRPLLSQLRSSGALEQDADAVLLLHRPEKGTDAPGETFEIDIAKNRHGSTGRAALRYYPAVNRFEDSANIGGRTVTVKSWVPLAR